MTSTIETEDVVEWVAKAAERGEQLLKARPNLSLGTGESSFCHDDLRALLDTIERLREENARLRDALVSAKPIVSSYADHADATDTMVRSSNRVSNLIERALNQQ